LSTSEPPVATPSRSTIIATRNRRAAFIATALTVPVVVVLAFALSSGGSSGSDTPKAQSTAVVTVSAATPSPAAVEPCAQVLSQLPVQLDGSDPRNTQPSPDTGAAAVSWGDPPIVLLCGVARPKELTEGSAALVIGVGAVNWLPITGSSATVFIAIDRAVYIQVTVPKAYAQPPLATLSTSIAAALPAVCHVDDNEPVPTTSAPSGGAGTAAPVGPLCTHRP
jgi:Protein of unknown function (DUF3515)